MIKKYRKVRDHRHYRGKRGGVLRSICNLEYSIPARQKFLWFSTVDQTMNLTELAEEFKGQFLWLRKKYRKINKLFFR